MPTPAISKTRIARQNPLARSFHRDEELYHDIETFHCALPLKTPVFHRGEGWQAQSGLNGRKAER